MTQLFLRTSLALIVAAVAGCAVDADADADEAAEAADAVRNGTVTVSRPEIGLLEIDPSRIKGSMTAATGTVVLHRNVVLTSRRATGLSSSIWFPNHARYDAAGYGTFTVTSLDGERTVHRVVEAVTVDGFDADANFALVRIEPPVPESIRPATIATPEAVERLEREDARATFFGYGRSGRLCLNGRSTGEKSFFTERLNQIGGLFKGPDRFGYACPADVGGPVVAGSHDGNGAVLTVNVNSLADEFAVPGLHRVNIEGFAKRWARGETAY
jgi:hypothetical protein